MKNIYHRFLMAVTKIRFNKFPMFVQYNYYESKFHGFNFNELVRIIENNKLLPGDILLSSYVNTLSDILIPGRLSHSSMYYGKDNNNNHLVIQAMHYGVVTRSVYDFINADNVVVLRLLELSDDERLEIIKNAMNYLDRPYDYSYTYGSDYRIYCNELVGRCYEFIKDKFKFKFTTKKYLFFKPKKILLADDFLKSDLKIIFSNSNIHNYVFQIQNS